MAPNDKKTLTGMRIEPEKLNKLKYISWFDRRTFTGVVDIAIEDYIKKWEAENGDITPEQIEKAAKK